MHSDHQQARTHQQNHFLYYQHDLSPDNLDQIASAIEKNELPETTGFFFGESSWHEEEKEKNVEIFRKASTWLRSKWDGENKYSNNRKDWVSVQYLASW